ncbi:MAG: hypothetical protein WAW10_05320 [Gallionella sp.]
MQLFIVKMPELILRNFSKPLASEWDQPYCRFQLADGVMLLCFVDNGVVQMPQTPHPPSYPEVNDLPFAVMHILTVLRFDLTSGSEDT